MKEEKIICISCPKGCNVVVTHENGRVLDLHGFQCPKGKDYAENEFTAPVRVLTTTVRVRGGELPLLPVKTRTPIPKGRLFDCMVISCGLEVDAPVNIGAVICADIAGTGVDLIATRDLAAGQG